MSSDSKAVAKRSEATELMGPPPPPSTRIKRPAKVLDEDTYTDALSHIIARDFFPGLAESEAQQDYLDSLESKDRSWIETAGKKLAGMMTPGPDGRRKRTRHSATSMTPTSGIVGFAGDTPADWVGETPGSVTGTAKSEKPEVNTNMSLSTFQSKYTSEDNESFYKLLDKQNQKKRDKYAWLWHGNKVAAPRQIAYRKQQAAIEGARTEQEKEDGKTTLAIEDSEKRPAMPDAWKLKPDNNFMFEPGSVEDHVETVQQKAEAISRAAPKAVVYDNTRLPEVDPTDTKRPSSPTQSAIIDAAAGRPRLAGSEINSVAGNETPRVNGYTFVDSESEDESEPEQDWSKLSLGSGDATPNPFKISEVRSREDLHHRMVDKVAKDKRTSKLISETKTPIPKFPSSPRLSKAGMTPAAQKLLGKLGGKTPTGNVWESGSTPRQKSGLGDWSAKVKTPRKN